MEKHKSIIVNNVIAFVVLGLLMSIFGFIGVGAAAIILGLVNLLVALIAIFTKNKITLQGCLIFAGIFFLVGTSLCSAFPLK